MTEAELQEAIVQWAHIAGWKVIHFRPARTLHGWRTPGSYDANGWPDLVGFHPDRHTPFAWELKSGRGRPSEDQLQWLTVLEANGFDTRIVQPVHLDACIDWLTAHTGMEIT